MIIKIGFVITNHFSKNRLNGREFLKNLLSSIEENIEINKSIDIYIIDNQSDVKLEKKYYNDKNNIKYFYHYIADQSIGGLTYAWNYGIKIAVENNCDVIINLNDDLVIDKTINSFIDTIINHPDKNISLFGPTTDKGSAPDIQIYQKNNKIIETSGIKYGNIERQNFFKGHPLNGFALGFTKEAYFKFNIDGWFFSRDIRDAWGCQEDEFYFRNKPLGLKNYVVGSCYIKHFKLKSWFFARQKYNHPRRTILNYSDKLQKASCY